MRRRRRDGWIPRLLAVLVVAGMVGVFNALPGAAADSPPTIDVWYGDVQRVGEFGRTQQWANVLGRVSDVDGTVTSLTYSLNNGPARPLTIGADNHPRLNGWGDFNVEIDRASLVSGNNTVKLTATDQAGNKTNRTVTLVNTPSTTWPLPTRVDWDGATRPTDRLDVVDGRWSAGPGGVTVQEPGYDRLLAVGDVTWTDYEVEVPVTVHSFNATEGGIGFFLRWTGHTESSPHQPGMQPRVGWKPSGALTWYRGLHGHAPRVEIGTDDEDVLAADGSGFTLTPGSTYVFRASVQRTPSGDRYSTTVFPQGQPESAGVTLTAVDTEFSKDAGSVLLLAHRSSVTFGDVVVTEIDGEEPPPPPNQPPVAVADQLTTSVGQPVTANLLANDSDPDGALVATSVSVVGAPAHGTATVNPTSGEVTYTPAAGYVGADSFTYTVADDEGATSNAATVSVTVTDGSEPPPPSSGLVSDEFSSSTFGSHWSWYDPVGDGTRAATGSHANLAVPGGVSHDLWSGALRAPRLLQDANDTDFQVQVKMDSPVSSPYQMQGIVVQQDADDLIRFEVHHDGGSARVFVATITGGSASGRANAAAPNGAPYWLRVTREGDTWTFERSSDGTTWTTVTSFDHDMQVDQAGLFVGNHTPSPPHTASFDHFRVTSQGDPPPPTTTTTAAPTTTTTAPTTTTTAAPTTTTAAPTTTTTAPTTTTAAPTTTTTAPTTTTTTTTPPPAGSAVSDEFNSGSLGSHWTWVDPVGDSTRTATGSHANLAVPAGTSHDLWTGALRAPRLLQDTTDGDVVLEVKIDSPVSSAYQMQGIVVQQDADDLIRFEVHHDGGSARVFVASIEGGSASSRANVAAGSSSSYWLRLTRSGDTWTFERSTNGTTWSSVTSFSRSMDLGQVGVFVGNHTPSPAHTASFDYFRVS